MFAYNSDVNYFFEYYKVPETEETKEITTFPYIVVEISGTEKEVMFD